jgi:nucleoside 2-deoxyribosyltransferase
VHPNLKTDARAGLTRYIDEHPEEQPVLITDETVSRVLQRPPIPISERAHLLARALVRSLGHKPGHLKLTLSPHVPLFCDLMRACYEDSVEGFVELLKYWSEQGVISLSVTQDGIANIYLPVRGLVKLEEGDKAADSKTAFVAMWFAPEMTAAYDEGIAPAVEELGYLPVRIDRQEHNNKIDDEIILEIRRANFLVADFSCDDKGARGGVYYEAGFAAGLGKPVIYMVRKENLERVHFDTRQFNHVVWEDVGELREKLRNRIGASIGEYRRR